MPTRKNERRGDQGHDRDRVAVEDRVVAVERRGRPTISAAAKTMPRRVKTPARTHPGPRSCGCRHWEPPCCLDLLCHPRVELPRSSTWTVDRIDGVAEPAQLGAHDGVVARPGRCDPVVRRRPRHRVDLHAEGRDPEVVDDVLGLDGELDLLALGQVELLGGDLLARPPPARGRSRSRRTARRRRGPASRRPWPPRCRSGRCRRRRTSETSRIAGIAVQMISSRVLPWIGGPSSSSSPGPHAPLVDGVEHDRLDEHEDRDGRDDQDVPEGVDRPRLRRGRRSGTSRSASPSAMPIADATSRDGEQRDDVHTAAADGRIAALGRRSWLLHSHGARSICDVPDERNREPIGTRRAARGGRRKALGRDGMAEPAEVRGAAQRDGPARRGRPTARRPGSGGTPWRTGPAGGSRRGGRPRGRSARGRRACSAARCMRTRVRWSRNVVLPISA